MRASVLANDRTTKVNEAELKAPPIKFVNKIKKEEHLAEHAHNKEIEECSPNKQALKFEMRHSKNTSVMRNTMS